MKWICTAPTCIQFLEEQKVSRIYKLLNFLLFSLDLLCFVINRLQTLKPFPVFRVWRCIIESDKRKRLECWVEPACSIHTKCVPMEWAHNSLLWQGSCCEVQVEILSKAGRAQVKSSGDASEQTPCTHSLCQTRIALDGRQRENYADGESFPVYCGSTVGSLPNYPPPPPPNPFWHQEYLLARQRQRKKMRCFIFRECLCQSKPNSPPFVRPRF